MQGLNSGEPSGTPPRSYRGGYACGDIHRIEVNEQYRFHLRRGHPHVPSPPPGGTTDDKGAHHTHVNSHHNIPRAMTTPTGHGGGDEG